MNHTRHQRFDRIKQLTEAKKQAKYEDRWDQQLAKAFGGNFKTELANPGGGSWTDEIRLAYKQVANAYAAATEKKKVRAKKMTGIVEEEKRLAQEERKTRRQEYYLQKRIRYLKRHGRDDEAGVLHRRSESGWT